MNLNLTKRIFAALVLAVVAGGSALAAPEWSETELPHGFCWNYGNQPIGCDLKPLLSVATPAASVTPTKITPAPSATMAPAPVELSNPDFEAGFAAWQVVVIKGAPNALEEHALAGAIHSGETALRFGRNYQCFRAGVRQTVSVPPGSRLRFSAWGRAYARNDAGLDLSRPSDLNVHAGVWVGLDPQAGTDPGQSSIVWVQNPQNTNPLLGWVQATTEVFAAGPRLTVWALINLGVDGAPGQPGNACEWALQELAGWLDTARLEMVP